MSLVISAGEGDDPVVIAVNGELDMSTAPDLLDAVSMLIDSGQRRLVLDLDGLTFCDSAGISAFFRLRRRLGEGDGAPGLAPPAPIVRSVPDPTGMVELIAGATTLDWAPAGGPGWP